MRLRAGEMIGGCAAVALVAVLFLDWFSYGGGTVSGWNGLSKVTLVLLCLAIALALAVVVVTATRRSVAIAMLFDVVAALMGVIATLALALALITQPGLGHDVPSVAVDLRCPAYAGMALTIAVALGMWRAMADERVDAPDSAYTPPPPTPLGSS